MIFNWTGEKKTCQHILFGYHTFFSLLRHGTYKTQTVNKHYNFCCGAAQTPTKGHRLTALQTTHGSISTSFITAPGWLQTVVSYVRASSGFHLMTGPNFQHSSNDICNCFYSFSTASLVSVCRCELCGIIRHSVYKKDSKWNSKLHIFNLFVRFKKHFDNNEICQGWPMENFMQEILLLC